MPPRGEASFAPRRHPAIAVQSSRAAATPHTITRPALPKGAPFSPVMYPTRVCPSSIEELGDVRLLAHPPGAVTGTARAALLRLRFTVTRGLQFEVTARTTVLHSADGLDDIRDTVSLV
jgi:hypothetical protein